MLVEFGYRYVGTVRPRGKRKLVDRDYFGTAMLEIDETKLEDAPVALWWEPPGIRGAGQVPVRAVDGALYEPYFRSLTDPLAGSEVVPSDAPLSAFRNRTDDLGADAVLRMLTTENIKKVFFDLPFSGRDKPRPPRITEDEDIAVVDHTTSETSVLQIAERIKSTRLIDGVLYRKTECPVIQVEAGAYGQLRIDHPSALTELTAAHLESTYSIEHYQEASAFLTRDGMFDWHKRAPEPDIVDMSLTGFDETRFLITTAARRVVKLLSKSQNGHSSYSGNSAAIAMEAREVFATFVGLRDGLVNDVSNEDLVSHLQGFCASRNAPGIWRDVAIPVEKLLKRLSEADIAPEVVAAP